MGNKGWYCKMIDRFMKEYRWLSNFYTCDVEYRGLKFKSAEAAFQAQKCPIAAKSFTRLSPNKAKAKGRAMPLRSDWETVKDTIMYDIVKAKFNQNEDLKQALLDTGDEELVEGNTWNDLYWGRDLYTNKGKNKLGQILMKVREEIRVQSKSE